MTLRLFDTATREIRDFVPLTPGKVGIYQCGATVQGSPHVGHMRAAVAFDVLQRWLERAGNRVTMVRNVTDIGDKIIVKAAEEGYEWWAWALKHENEFHAAYQALGVKAPAYTPRATGHIPEMIRLMATLIEKGHAYAGSDGSVYFDVKSYPEYGSLTNQALEDMADAADSKGADAKRDPRDFALWKAVKPGEPASASWDSPWGAGRPGWHIECSAMAQRYLGDEFDIHTGGLDLRFPHHENEQAQSRAAGQGFARWWMHSAWVTQSGAKVSKSLGTTLWVDAVLAKHEAPALRLALAGVHYRSMLEYSEGTLEDATAAWGRLSGYVARASDRAGSGAEVTVEEIRAAELPAAFVAAMDDDLAVPAALAVIYEAVREGNSALNGADDALVRQQLVAVRGMLDVLGLDPKSTTWSKANSASAEAMAALDVLVRAQIDARKQAREGKDWAAADAIRDQLAAAGVVVEDGAEGARWSLSTEA